MRATSEAKMGNGGCSQKVLDSPHMTWKMSVFYVVIVESKGGIGRMEEPLDFSSFR